MRQCVCPCVCVLLQYACTMCPYAFRTSFVPLHVLCILSLRPKVIVTDVNLRGGKRHGSRGPCPGRTQRTKAQSGSALWDCDNYNWDPSPPAFREQVSWAAKFPPEIVLFAQGLIQCNAEKF